MNINNIKPMSGKILVKKLPDEFATKSGIILPYNAPINKRHELVEVISKGKDISDDMNIKITVNIGDKCLVMGKGIYDTINIDDDTFYIINASDIFATVE